MPVAKTNLGKKSEKEWRDAIRLAVHRPVEVKGSKEKRKALTLLAEQTVKMALDGDMQAIAEIGNRLDGRPNQAIEATVEHNYVARMPDVMEDADEWQQAHQTH